MGLLLVGKTKGFVVADKNDYEESLGKGRIYYAELVTSSSLEVATRHAKKIHKEAVKEDFKSIGKGSIIVVDVEASSVVLTLEY